MDKLKALNGIRQILSFLVDEELFNLAATITQGLLRNKLDTTEGAVEAILKYSPDLHSILKRKVITRDILFNYLHLNNVEVTLPMTKNDLINAVCVYWNLKHQEIASVTSQPNTDKPTSTNNLQPEDINMLAVKFSEWFYSMMNLDVPIGQEHFWNDSKLQLNLISANQEQKEEIRDNVKEIVGKLFKTKTEHSLYFNPNLLHDGTQGRMDPHGLVIVLSCGTLHSNNVCVGVFEQVFFLMRDPFANNNWKIKSTNITLRSKNNVYSPPQLCDSSAITEILTLSKP